MSKTIIANGQDQIVRKTAVDACAVQDAVNLVAIESSGQHRLREQTELALPHVSNS